MAGPRIGLVGCGAWGRHILRDLRSLGCEVDVVARSDASVTIATDGGADRIVRAVDELDAVEGIVVATPMETHAEVVEAVLPHRVPVYVEKPFTTDLDAAETLAAAAPERIFVLHKWRYHPGVQALARLAADGAVGEVVGLTTERLQWGEGRGPTDVVWHLVPHDLSIGLEILGPTGALRSVVGHELGGLLVEVHAVLGDPDRPWHALTVSRARHQRRRLAQVHGTTGVAWLGDGWDESIFVAADGGSEPVEIPTPGDLPLLAQLRAFVEHLGGGPPPRSSAAEALAEVRTLDAIRAALGAP